MPTNKKKIKENPKPVKKNIKKKTSKTKDKVSKSKEIKDTADEHLPVKKNLDEPEPADTNAIERGDKPMSVVRHLHELRSRLIASLITIGAVTLLSFLFFSDYILFAINRPYIKTGLKLNVFTLTEGFIIRAKASIIMGIIVGLPVIVFEIWKYIVPAINKRDRKFIRKSVIGSVFLMYAGIALTYFILLPVSIKMLLKITPENMNSVISANKYLTFASIFGLSMGLLFELPVVIMILTKVGMVTPRLLTSKRKYAIVLIWIAAAILTPGADIFSQSMVAVPVMLLYEVSIIISKVIYKRKLIQDANY